MTDRGTDRTTVPSEMHVLVPFWGMAGGVIKILDYATHALRAGVEHVRLWGPPIPEASTPVTTLPVFRTLEQSPNVTIEQIEKLSFGSDPAPVVLFTEPTHDELIDSAASAPLGHRLIHLVQGTRHADPSWSAGRNYRLLHRPMSRIMVTDQVAEATAPHRNLRFPARTILEGHDVDFFAEGAPRRTGRRSVFRVLYATWKSDLGDRVAELLSDRTDFMFDPIRGECGWPELRRRYHAADLFICSPGPEEGFYLPGIEAMAAGCAVVSSFVGGNASYMVDGQNMLGANFDDPTSHGDALVTLAENSELRNELIAAGARTVAHHRLDREAEEFADFLTTLHQLGETPALASQRGADR